MIRRGDNPEGHPLLNKYLGKDGNGYRGKLVATNADASEAIIETISLVDSEPTGRLILVRELFGDREYPTEICDVAEIPKGWLS